MFVFHNPTFRIRNGRPSKLPASCLIGIPDGEATMERPPFSLSCKLPRQPLSGSRLGFLARSRSQV